MNFNDFGASLVTLFHIQIINNWFITCDMYMYVFESSWILLYFISFWMLANCIMINLVIAFVLDIYGNVSNEVEAEFKKRDYV